MKLHNIAASATLAIAPLAAGLVGVGFDSLPASTPGVITEGGEPVTPNPFKGLVYDPEVFSVVTLDEQLLPLLKPTSPSNVLVTRPLEVGRHLGSITRDSKTISSFDAVKLYFACATDVAGETTPLNCSVLFEGSPNELGISPNEVATYNGGSQMQLVQLDFMKTRSLSFAVNSANLPAGLPELGNVSVVIDSIYYTPHNK